MDHDYLIYEDKPVYGFWLKFLVFFLTVPIFALGILFMQMHNIFAFFMFGLALFDILLFTFVIPHAYRIYSDRLVIVLTRPFSMTIYFRDIDNAQRVPFADDNDDTLDPRVRFVTSFKYLVEIARRKGVRVIISPRSGDIFLDRLNHARKIG
jgi:hypothetical protein